MIALAAIKASELLDIYSKSAFPSSFNKGSYCMQQYTLLRNSLHARFVGLEIQVILFISHFHAESWGRDREISLRF